MSDTDESELINVMDNVLDEYDRDEETSAPPDARPDPVGMVARAMVEAAVAGRSDLLASAAMRGAVVIVVAPHGWMDAIAPAWRRIVLGQPEDPADHNEYIDRRRRERAAEKWPLGVGVDMVQKDYANGDVARALRMGRGVLVTVNAIKGVDPSLRAAADLEVTIDPPTPEILRQVAETYGAGTGSLVDVATAAAVQPGHLLGCLRPFQAAASYTARLERVVAACIPTTQVAAAPAWTLDRLHGNPEVKAFGRALAVDMKSYIAGDLPWSDVSPGVLLSGPPGCGKTVTAAAIAHECGVRFFSTSYSEWQGSGKEGHSGELIKCLRSRFAQARMGAPCILFLDELDSVRSRSGNGALSVRNDDW